MQILTDSPPEARTCQASLTFQAKYPFPQSIHNVLKCCFICDIKEMFVIRIARYKLYLIQKGFGIDSSSVIITQYLGLKEEKQDSGVFA